MLNSESIVRCGDPRVADTRYVEYGPLTNAFSGLAVKSRRIGVSPG
ncbi:hypothetical protein [Streptomyces sp. TLI_171]|nr:hypothetical protein [Streptomyces sp. TLI_171]